MAAAKEIITRIKLLVPAGGAKPAPPVGPALGGAGLNIMNFCKDFNAKTQDFQPDVPIPVEITAFKDKTFEWRMKTPPVSYFIKKAAGINSGSSNPGHSSVSGITLQHVYEIARVKQNEDGMRYVPLEGICKSIVGTAKSMGVPVVDIGEGPIPPPPPPPPSKYEHLPDWIQDLLMRRKESVYYYFLWR